MATYPAISLTTSGWTDITSAGVDRTAQVMGGDVWVSDDASPSDDTAQRLRDGERFFIASGKTYKARRISGFTQLRLMDY